MNRKSHIICRAGIEGARFSKTAMIDRLIKVSPIFSRKVQSHRFVHFEIEKKTFAIEIL